MSAKKCVHKGCAKVFTDDAEPCVYHPGPPEFHEGQKGWTCCKPRVLTFDEFLSIPPCTTGLHSTIDDTPAPAPKPKLTEEPPAPTRKPIQPSSTAPISTPPISQTPPPAPEPEPESSDDEPSLTIPPNATCRRRACGKQYQGGDREGEECVHHPGAPVFHEGSKGWSCCKRRVLEFDEFMKIGGCVTKGRHLFVGSGRKKREEVLETVRHDFYQTATAVMASLYLKKIDKATSVIEFSSPTTITLDLKTADEKRYKTEFPLFGPIDTEKSTHRVMGAKLELQLVKADGRSWGALRSDEKLSGGIIQTGKAGVA